MDYRRIGLAGGQLVQKGLGSIRQGYGGPQDWGQEEAAKQQGAANVAASNPYSNVAQQQNRALNERVSREGRSNISRQNFQQGLKDFYNTHQGGIGGGIRNIGGGIRNFFGGLKDKFGAWAGNMRGGINPQTGQYYTQDEYEQNVQNRRNQASIDRIRKTKGLYDSGVIDRDWNQSPLKDRLAGLEKGQWDRMSAMGMPTDTGYPGESQGIESINDRVNLNDFEGVNFNERIAPDTAGSLTRSGMKNMEIANNPNLQYTSDMSVRPVSTWSERVGNRLGVDLQEAAAVKDEFLQKQDWYNNPLTLRNNLLATGLSEDPVQRMQDVETFKQSYQSPLTISKYLDLSKRGKVPSTLQETFNEQVLGNIGDAGGFGDTFPKNYSFGNIEPTFQDGRLDIDETQLDDDYLDRVKYLDLATGGRVGYNTGGRVGILAAF